MQNQLDRIIFDHLILIGDFNGTVDNKLDRTGNTKKGKNKTGKLPNSFFKIVKNEDLTDVWRDRNQGTKDYTFYSSRHKTWSRINMFWISRELSTESRKIDIMTRTISDHNPILW